jgi:hypothetical protein
VLELHACVSHLYLTVQLLYYQQLLIAPVAPLRRPNKKQMMKLAKERVAKEAAQRKRCVTLTNTSSTLCCATLAPTVVTSLAGYRGCVRSSSS